MIQNKIYTIIGHKGYGKTVLTEKIALLTNKPTIFLDPRLQYLENDRRLIFKSINKFKNFITQRDNYKAFINYKLELIVNCIDVDDSEELASIIYKMKNITFVIDEIDMFFDTRTPKTSYFNKLVQYGRHNQIDIITTSRRPANISRNLTALTDIFYFSRLREPNDKLYIKNILGAEFMDQVAELEKFSFLRVEDEEKEIIKTTEKDLKILQT